MDVYGNVKKRIETMPVACWLIIKKQKKMVFIANWWGFLLMFVVPRNMVGIGTYGFQRNQWEVVINIKAVEIPFLYMFGPHRTGSWMCSISGIHPNAWRAKVQSEPRFGLNRWLIPNNEQTPKVVAQNTYKAAHTVLISWLNSASQNPAATAYFSVYKYAICVPSNLFKLILHK